MCFLFWYSKSCKDLFEYFMESRSFCPLSPKLFFQYISIPLYHLSIYHYTCMFPFLISVSWACYNVFVCLSICLSLSLSLSLSLYLSLSHTHTLSCVYLAVSNAFLYHTCLIFCSDLKRNSLPHLFGRR